MRYSCGTLHIALLLVLFYANAQSVSIKEETMSLDTYGYGKPNPIPIVAENPKIIPYYKFEEYEHKSSKKDWKVVTLENDYIKVFVLPEIGGKVWGAIEKKTGEEFLYKNEVVKFRNIAMRGPWTSGGIEFNFGIIGHHPSTASSVDYVTRTNSDGSVSCIVGSKDLPSNTNWTVEIRLEEGKAYFETNASWYNASPLTQSYYNWMTAAAVATYDLEFFIPGNTYVEHNGNAHSWPVDEKGRNLSMYKNNTFGPSKSYHIVGEYNDFFGGYYHNKNFGFGTWSLYEEMPGQKLWLWDLSRGGGIWEDLLTDSDGQYIEFQAGRLFDQYSAGAVNPISQVGFDPYVMDTWSEIWFPYKEIGGMEDASKEGVLNVESENGQTYVGLNALQKLSNDILVRINGEIVLEEQLNLQPMGVFSKTISTEPDDKIEVSIKGTELHYTNDPEDKVLKRPFYPDENLKVSTAERLLQEGMEALEYREFALAHEKLTELVNSDPSHRTAHIALAELEYRKTNYNEALKLCNMVLRMDTYNSGANYIAGITYRAKKDYLNALESLGWAARDIKYRSVAHAQMAEIYLTEKKYARAKMYALKALTHNVNNINAREVLMILARINGDKEKFERYAKDVLYVDPLNHLVAIETAMIEGFGKQNQKELFKGVKNEFKEETALGLAIRYHGLGLDTEALLILLTGPSSPKNKLWVAYLQNDANKVEGDRILEKVISSPIDLVFPYRRETIPVLEWAVNQNENWKLKYYLAHNYLSVGLDEKGKNILRDVNDTPDSDIFYRFRAAAMKDSDFAQRARDYQKALEINTSDWKVWEENIQFNLKYEKYSEAYALSRKAYKKFKNNYNIGLAHAKALLNTGNYSEVLLVLQKIQVLPYEHASESREIYDRAHLAIAAEHIAKKKFKTAITILKKSKEWPENIGVGRPYDPDERAQDYLLAMSYAATGDAEKQQAFLDSIVEYTNNHIDTQNLNHLFGLLASKKLGDEYVIQQLSSTIKSSGENTGSKNELVLALFAGDLTKSNTIMEELKLPTDRREILIKASKF